MAGARPGDDDVIKGGSFSELAHLVWAEAAERNSKRKHPLAPLIAAWQSGPLEVQAVRDPDGNLRADVILPRLAMRREMNSGTDKLYLTPAYIGPDSEGMRSRCQDSRIVGHQGGFRLCRSTFTILVWKPARLVGVGERPRFPPVCSLSSRQPPRPSCGMVSGSYPTGSPSGTCGTHSIHRSDWMADGDAHPRWARCGRA